MLILTGTHFRSTVDPGLSEWAACDRPLGVWATLWVLRAILASILAYWDYLRNRSLRFRLSVKTPSYLLRILTNHLCRHPDTEATVPRQDPAAVNLQDPTTRNTRGNAPTTNNHANNHNQTNNARETLPPPPRLYSR